MKAQDCPPRLWLAPDGKRGKQQAGMGVIAAQQAEGCQQQEYSSKTVVVVPTTAAGTTTQQPARSTTLT